MSKTTYTPEMASTICAELASGETLLAISKKKGRPSRDAVWRWLKKYSEFRELYDRAIDMQRTVWADQIIDLSDDSSGDYILAPDGKTKIVNRANIDRCRVMIDTRKWFLARLMPKVYGDRIAAEVSTPPGQPFEVLNITDEDRARAVVALLSKTKPGGLNPVEQLPNITDELIAGKRLPPGHEPIPAGPAPQSDAEQERLKRLPPLPLTSYGANGTRHKI
jgi:hypothetical protein